MGTKLLVISVAALDKDLNCNGIRFKPMDSILPAVTCSVQASFRTGLMPSEHGMISNGVFSRPLRKAMFWEQSSALVSGRRIWQGPHERGAKVAILFWQQSLGEQADMIISPAPIHKHHGGMIQDCYSQPRHLYPYLKSKLGAFKLRNYWGPMAGPGGGRWIAKATAEILRNGDFAPDICLTYLPMLDYPLQRHDPTGDKANSARLEFARDLEELTAAAQEAGYSVLIYGDYSIEPVTSAVRPNFALARAGLMKTRNVQGMLYPDIFSSRAFAMVDHQVAHVYVADHKDIPQVVEVLADLEGVEDVLPPDRHKEVHLNHPNSGEVIVTARSGWWFAYSWWAHPKEAPDYARHIDIHNKPGYDPCELFWGWPPGSVSLDSSRIRGSHGRVGPAHRPVYGADFDLDAKIDNVVDLAKAVEHWLEVHYRQ